MQPFKSADSALRYTDVDPGLGEAWWWLGIPLCMCAFILVVHAVSPSFYETYILPEGYGFLEVGHLLIPAAAAILAFMAARKLAATNTLATGLLIVFALGCIFIAGEEHSWGQHIFNWSTPDYWANINRQQETNLHNTSSWLNHKPRTVLEIGMIVGGLIAPFALRRFPGLVPPRLEIFAPTLILLPTVLGYGVFKLKATLAKDFGWGNAIVRPAEATETFIYLFLLFFMLLVMRRVRAQTTP